jgi:hypothetical protein
LSGLQLAAGATCTLGVEFEPAAAGLVHGHVNVVDNTLNAPSPTYATQTVALQGTGDAAATMTSPTPGSTLGTTNVTFTWGGGAGVTAYELILGTTGFGSHDLYNSGLITATTATVSSIPANLKTVYARLCSEISGVLSCNNYTYTEAGTPTLATMISPISGSTLGTTNVKFTWGGEAGVTAYELILGTTGFGSHDLYNSGLITATTATVSSIPANLATVYARLCSKISGVLSCNNYSYTEAGTPIPATMTSPTGGSTLGTTNVKFTWTSGAGATAYELILGTTGFGSHDLYNSGLITATTATISSLPANAVTVYARLCSKISGVLSCNNYTYTEQ